MITVYQIRGTNGSGKSTLARAFIAGDPAATPNRKDVRCSPTVVDLAWYPAPTKREPERRKSVEGYCSPQIAPGLDVLVVGSYRTACGGLDGVPDFETSFAAIREAARIHATYGEAAVNQAIIAEGVLASTVWGSWGEFHELIQRYSPGQAELAFCYLDTPVEVCLERIKKRQEAAGKVRPINEQLVRDKVKAIAATRLRALAAGALVYDLPWRSAEEALRAIMTDVHVPQVDHHDRTSFPLAREFYRGR